MMTIDLGYGTLTGSPAAPPNTLTGIQILADDPSFDNAELVHRQDKTLQQIDVPTSPCWEVEFMRTEFPNLSSSDSRLLFLLKFWQSNKKYVRIYGNRFWKIIHPDVSSVAVWVSVFTEGKFPLHRMGDGASGLFSFKFELYEGTPTDLEAL